MNTAKSSSPGTFLRSLQVLFLATIGLAVYIAGFAVLVLVCGLIVSACAHA